jgi:hypothetical protein
MVPNERAYAWVRKSNQDLTDAMRVVGKGSIAADLMMILKVYITVSDTGKGT